MREKATGVRVKFKINLIKEETQGVRNAGKGVEKTLLLQGIPSLEVCSPNVY